jgi:hypothetical protein
MGILDQAVMPTKRKNMKQFIKKIFGFDKIEEESAKAIKELAEIKAAVAPKTPKEIATENREPWVAVLDTHVNKDNIRNGFFELDWNEYFVLQLRAAGYAGDTDEAIVDQWFSELCRNVGGDEGVDMSRRGAGYINVNNLGNGRTEVS